MLQARFRQRQKERHSQTERRMVELQAAFRQLEAERDSYAAKATHLERCLREQQQQQQQQQLQQQQEQLQQQQQLQQQHQLVQQQQMQQKQGIHQQGQNAVTESLSQPDCLSLGITQPKALAVQHPLYTSKVQLIYRPDEAEHSARD